MSLVLLVCLECICNMTTPYLHDWVASIQHHTLDVNEIVQYINESASDFNAKQHVQQQLLTAAMDANHQACFQSIVTSCSPNFALAIYLVEYAESKHKHWYSTYLCQQCLSHQHLVHSTFLISRDNFDYKNIHLYVVPTIHMIRVADTVCTSLGLQTGFWFPLCLQMYEQYKLHQTQEYLDRFIYVYESCVQTVVTIVLTDSQKRLLYFMPMQAAIHGQLRCLYHCFQILSSRNLVSQTLQSQLSNAMYLRDEDEDDEYVIDWNCSALREWLFTLHKTAFKVPENLTRIIQAKQDEIATLQAFAKYECHNNVCDDVLSHVIYTFF